MYDRTMLNLSGVEVSNAWRTLDYVAKAKAAGLYDQGYDVYCEQDWRCWQDQGTYLGVAADPAPWYDPLEAASTEFLGLTIESMTGLDTTTSSRDMASRVTRGGVAGRRFDAPRTVVVTAQMHAVSSRGMLYGQQWLVSLMTGCDECSGADGTMTFRAACAPVGSTLDYRRSTTDVALLKWGEPTLLMPDDPASGDFFQTITFTLGLGSPDWYSVANAPGGFTGQAVYLGGAAGCNAVPTCCNTLRDLRRYQWRATPSVGGAAGADPIPTITITAGSTPLWMRVEAHQATGTGTGNCVNQQPLGDGYACDPPLTAMNVTGLPVGATLVLSGTDGRAYLYPAGGGAVLPGDPYIDPDGTKGVAGLLDICGDICVLGAATDLQPVSIGATWSVGFQYRYRIG